MQPDSFRENLEVYESLRTQHRLLPVKVSRFFQSKVDEEVLHLKHRSGPLHRIVYPSTEKLKDKQLYEVNDFVDDRANMPSASQESFIHKYKKTVLFMPLSHCLSNCMYCFRQDVLEEKESAKKHSVKSELIKSEQKLERQLEALIAYLNEHPELEEVILSGGDPMMLPADQLDHIFTCLAEQTQVCHFRLHTKAIVFDPRSFSTKHQACLEKHRVRVVFHIVHPYELCPEVEEKISELRRRGIRLYNHFPILRHINDHVDVLIENIKACDELGINTLSIYFPDPVQYSAAYRVSFQRLLAMVKDFNHNTPSWINATRFCQDTVHGKVRPDDLVEYDHTKGYALFEREGQLIKVPDHPLHLDHAGDLSTMLWKR